MGVGGGQDDYGRRGRDSPAATFSLGVHRGWGWHRYGQARAWELDTHQRPLEDAAIDCSAPLEIGQPIVLFMLPDCIVVGGIGLG